MDIDEQLPMPHENAWWHASLAFPGGNAPPGAAQALAKALGTQRYHFLRKDAGVRLRTAQPAPALLDRLVTEGHLASWTGGIYEPETSAFGGPRGMDVAHDLFCADSSSTLRETGSPGTRERCVMLLSTLLRHAGLDPYEAGDVWARLADERPAVAPPHGDSLERAVSAMRRLTTAEPARRPEAEPGWAERVAAFEDAGRQLRRLAAEGQLIRGLRAVLAHHMIFAFNRAGVPASEQAATAWLGRHMTFDAGQSDDAPLRNPADPRLSRSENPVTPDTKPDALRAALAERLIRGGHLRSQAPINAFQTTDRHHFLPGIDLEAAYKEDAVPIKHDETGEMISCISAPSIVATQLEQLDARPGHHVLEAGAATGYNAALLSSIVSPGGHVWTLDVDQDLVAGAQANLAQAGINNVTAMLADGAGGLPEHAPYDRIIFTVGAGDVPAKVLDQLAPDGRLVLPMRIRGSISRSFAFERDGETWRTVSCEMATFIPLRKGVCDDVYTLVPHAGEGNVRLETFSEQEVDRDAMPHVLDQKRTRLYTGVKFRQGDPWEWLYLYLACVLPNGLSRLPGARPGFTPHFAWGSMAALDGDSLAYLTVYEGEDEQGRFWEIGVIAHGTSGADLAEQVAHEIRAWNASGGNNAPEPTFRMTVADARNLITADDERFIIDKPSSRLVVDWARRA